MSYEELEQLVKSHEEALLIVADTEEMARELINICLWLNVVSIAIAIDALMPSNLETRTSDVPIEALSELRVKTNSMLRRMNDLIVEMEAE